jgi:hypothetical protein
MGMSKGTYYFSSNFPINPVIETSLVNDYFERSLLVFSTASPSLR